MNIHLSNKKFLGINSLGRIGKLLLWHQLIERYFDGVVINVGREIGKKTEDIIDFLETDSTYGDLSHFLYGKTGKKVKINKLDSDDILLDIDGFPVKILSKQRNPKNIGWSNEQVYVVVDCSGQFLDPSVNIDTNKGCLRGHLEAGAQKVILSAPYKLKNSAQAIPDDTTMIVYGINHFDFLPNKHHIISAASCTTTALAHMIKPIIETEKTSQILTASMSTVHAATNTQSVLDAVPSTGTSDLRKNRSVLNNIILSSTGAAKALEEVLPQIQQIGFMADSVRIPTNTVSLISLNITFSSGIDLKGVPSVNKEVINNLYKQAASGAQKDMLIFSSRQNVSSDIIGKQAAIIIEGHETHTRTGFLKLNSNILLSLGIENHSEIALPVTHAKIFGWYDNEHGSYVNMLSKLTQFIYSRL
jgi:glyceraldehyde 3-phosphate dehydrogenase